MRLRLPWVSVIALVLLVPAGTAVPLSGMLQWDEPALVSGALTFGPGSTGSVAFVKVDPDSQAPATPLIRADSLRLILHHWDGNQYLTSKEPAPLRGVLEDRQTILDLSHVSVTLQQLGGEPQVLVTEPAARGPPAAPARAAATQCSIEDPGTPDQVVYPDDHASRADPQWKVATRGDRQLTAACRIDDYATQTPGRLYVYGMRLALVSDECRDVIETGTYDESASSDLESVCQSAPGTAQPPPRMHSQLGRVTQILELQDLGAPLLTNLRLRSTVRIYSEEFVAIGDLRVATSHGELTWGPDSHHGRIHAFAAEGEFQLRGRDNRFVGLEGNTLTSPQGGPVETVTPSPMPLAVAFAETAAAIGLVALLLRGLLFLYARLSPQRLLSHPRRAKILEFVTREPGVDAASVSRVLGIRPTKVHYHVRRLTVSGHLTIRRLGTRLALFPARASPPKEALKIALLRRTTLGQIHELLAAEPGLDQAGIARRLELTQSHVSRSLQSLLGVGLVKACVRDRRRRYAAVPI